MVKSPFQLGRWILSRIGDGWTKLCLETGGSSPVKGRTRWTTEAQFLIGDTRAPNRPAFLAGLLVKTFGHNGFGIGILDEYGDDKQSARTISLKDGEIGTLTNEPVAHWLAADGGSLYSGDFKRDAKTIAHGRFGNE